MAIPPLTDDGHLPHGEHPCSLVEVEGFFAHNCHRRVLFGNLKRLLHKFFPESYQLTLFIGGSFVTIKEEPNDIDISVLFVADMPLFRDRKCADKLIEQKAEIKWKYSIDVFFGKSASEILQRFRPGELNKQPMPTHLKGVLRIDP